MFTEEELKNEVWRDVKGYEPFYEVSNLGRIRSKDRVIIRRNGKPHPVKGIWPHIYINHWGYPMVALSVGVNRQKRRFVHRLVAETFIENPRPDLYNQINHIDGNKRNNRIENLEWTNCSLNQIHAYKLGLHKPTDKLNKKVIQLDDDGNIIKIWDSLHHAERGLGGKCVGHIWGCLKGERKHCKGYKWKYYDELDLHRTESA